MEETIGRAPAVGGNGRGPAAEGVESGTHVHATPPSYDNQVINLAQIRQIREELEARLNRKKTKKQRSAATEPAGQQDETEQQQQAKRGQVALALAEAGLPVPTGLPDGLMLPGGVVLTARGISIVKQTPKGDRVEHAAYAPIIPIGTLETVDERERYYFVVWWDSTRQAWRETVIPHRDALDHRRVVAWTAEGLPITSQSAKWLGEYFVQMEVENSRKSAWKLERISRTITWTEIGGERLLVLPHAVWGPGGPLAGAPVRFSDRGDVDWVQEIAPAPPCGEDEAREIIGLLLRCAAPWVSHAVAGWLAAAILAPVFRDIVRVFPHAFVGGRQGAGKTTLLSTFILLFAGYSSPRSARRPQFSLLRELSITDCIPLYIDEYRRHNMTPEELQRIHHFLRGAYNGMKETRGLPDQSTRDYWLRAPCVISGETIIEDPALRERCLMVLVSRNDIVDYPGAREAMSGVWRCHGADALRAVAGLVLARALGTPRVAVERLLEEARSEVAGHPVAGKLGDRPALAVAVALAGLRWLETVGLAPPMEDEAVRDMLDRLARPHLESDASDPLAVFTRFLEAQAALPPVRRSVPMRYDPAEGVLVVHQAVGLSEFAEWSRRKGEMYLGREAVLHLLGQSDICRAVAAVRRIHGASARAIVLDTKALHSRYGIPEEYWLGPGEEEPL